MSEHYYSGQPQTAHDERRIEASLRGRSWRFWTDAGVFSKGGVDFGSKLLIETMTIPGSAKVLDVGCGYGPIGLNAAVLATAGHVTMVDVNERAVKLAKRNAADHGIGNVTVLASDLYSKVPEASYDIVLSNPPIRAGKSVVHALFEGAAERLKDTGELWIVIQKKQGAPSAVEKLEGLFDAVELVERDKGYWIVKAKGPFKR